MSEMCDRNLESVSAGKGSQVVAQQQGGGGSGGGVRVNVANAVGGRARAGRARGAKVR